MARRVRDVVPVKVEVRRRAAQPTGDGRVWYQERYVEFGIRDGDRVLDVGSGGNPFPGATVLVERFMETSRHRHDPFERNGKPVVVADIQRLPFPNKSFDFVYCSHVMEHVDDPLWACEEIIRVGKRGYIETPTFGKDMLFAWAAGMHKWHVVAIADNLCFFEYSARQLNGLGSTAWRELIFSRWYHPLQSAFAETHDLFNVMFSWSDRFVVFVFRLDGSVQTINAPGRRDAIPHR
jgi:SAM-dependent methyltransferase